MDRIIAPYGFGPPGAPSPAVGSHGPTHASPSLDSIPKSMGDYLRAIRRRWWVAFGVGLALSFVGAAYVLRQPSIYQATAQIRIVPPEFNHALSVIVEHPANLNRDNTEQFVLDTMGQFGTKTLITSVVREFEPADPVAAAALVNEVTNSLVTKRVPGTSTFNITIESQDQDRVAKVLNALIRKYEEETKLKEVDKINNSKSAALKSLDRLRADLKGIDDQIAKIIKVAPYFAPDGRNFVEEEYLNMRSLLLQKKVRFEDLAYEQNLAEMWPGLHERGDRHQPRDGSLLELQKTRSQISNELRYYESTIRNHRNDPVVKSLRKRLGTIDATLDGFEEEAKEKEPAVADIGSMRLSRSQDEIRELERQINKQKVEMQQTAPQFQQFLGLRRQRDQLEHLITKTQENELRFESVSPTLSAPVVPLMNAVEPIAPVRPRRMFMIALISVLSALAGLGLVCGLEAMDRLVKVPDHLSPNLSLPLLGVVPRMRRMARMNRGGHLWTPAVPGTIEADAFRNLRASLIGSEPADAPHVTILITSAKAGEGKSTTALNLAATCALSGERTILVDCDLRRSSLAPVFDADPTLGLVDVLQGEMPWQRAVIPCTEIPGLSFLPSGHLDGVPIEILGSLELKQLVTALARQYHRVILDGPAILGLADGRMLGRLADTTLLVVRAGANELSPLKRAKAMLDQSRIHLGGIVFNDLNEDIRNWSSSGSYATESWSLTADADAFTNTRKLEQSSAATTA